MTNSTLNSKPRGGSRLGSGRHAQTTDGGPLQKRSISVDASTVNILTWYGEGNLSEGIRRASRLLLILKNTKE
jgi:hypothetical protein